MMRFEHPCIIAAVRNINEFERAAESSSKLIFDLTPNIRTIKERAQRAHETGKRIFLHMDLAEGIGKDAAGLGYVHECGADGVISTRAGMIRIARDIGLLTVQRFFIIDSQSVHSAMESLKSSKADMVEIMPGLLPKVIADLAAAAQTPVIAGGLIQTEAEVSAAFAAGAAGVSTGESSLWKRK